MKSYKLTKNGKKRRGTFASVHKVLGHTRISSVVFGLGVVNAQRAIAQQFEAFGVGQRKQEAVRRTRFVVIN